MRKQLLYFAIVVALLTLSSMKPDNPPGFVKFDENLFVSVFEVTNSQYQSFIEHLKENEPNKVENFLPDSNQWIEKFSYAEPHAAMYHWHPAWDNYPVVNINKEAIDNYCSWLTEVYNSNNKRQYKKIVYRLPTEKEWIKFSASLPGHKLPWYGNYPYILDKKNEDICMLTNIKVMDYSSGGYDYTFDGTLLTCEVGFYKPNKLGLHDIIGNAAELTSDNKIKGGSWDNTLSECYIDNTQNFELPDPRVGFRLVLEVIEL